ncbi:hypothetical protein I7I53_11932 [Histoplasma capsulatum var. duboisii H88]|uniref:Uncharacterized protein n=1 Tax=Ajellomyces capsulatus (strain H88) TaxID=544711 RepID=A0A8A1M0G1_AJEC8|nr:hypothetical protein I7I53_11932 [Histoplasma capsulatum var. duboisii H88]
MIFSRAACMNRKKTTTYENRIRALGGVSLVILGVLIGVLDNDFGIHIYICTVRILSIFLLPH